MKVLGVIAAIVIFVAMCFGLNYLAYGNYAFFAPKYTAVDNKVFQESAQYNLGMIRDLENLKMEYETGDATTKSVLKPTILHRFSVYPKDRLPPDLRSFYEALETN